MSSISLLNPVSGCLLFGFNHSTFHPRRAHQRTTHGTKFILRSFSNNEPFPCQNVLGHLPPNQVLLCLKDLYAVHRLPLLYHQYKAERYLPATVDHQPGHQRGEERLELLKGLKGRNPRKWRRTIPNRAEQQVEVQVVLHQDLLLALCSQGMLILVLREV